MTEQQTAPDVPRWLVNQWDHERRRLETASAELDRIETGLSDPDLINVTVELAAAEQHVLQLRRAKARADELLRLREAKSRELERIKKNVEHLRFAAEDLCGRLGIEVPDRPAEVPLDDTAANPVEPQPPFNLVDGREAAQVQRPGPYPQPHEFGEWPPGDVTRIAGAHVLPAPPPAPTVPDGPNGGDPATGRFQPGGDRRA